MLQTQALRVGQEKEPCIRVNTRELNRELFYKVVYLIYLFTWSVLATVQPTLKYYV